MKLRTVLLVALSALPITAFADFSGCSKFAGTYASITDYSRSPYLEISWDASHLILAYLDNIDGSTSSSDYTVAFVADGTQQVGDVINTGSSYTAACSVDGITIVIIGLFNSPYTMQFNLNAGILTEVDSFQGTSPQTTQYQVLSQ